MARIKLEFPEEILFSTDIEVRASDINYGGHVGNDKFLSFVQDARIQLLQALGYKNEVSLKGNIGMIVTDAALIYKSQLFLGDKIKIQISISNRNKYGFDFYYRVISIESERIVTIVKTGVVGFDYNKNKVVAFPEDFFIRCESLR